MPLSCQAYVTPASTPGGVAVQAFIIAFNPSATTSIAITGGALQVYQLTDGDADESPYYVSAAPNVLPLGPGMPTVVAPLSSLLVGPVPVVVHNNAGSNSFQDLGPAGVLVSPQPTDDRSMSDTGRGFPQFTAMVGGTLNGSDGSINQIAPAPLLVDIATPPPLGFQGGPLFLSAPNNLVTFLAGVL